LLHSTQGSDRAQRPIFGFDEVHKLPRIKLREPGFVIGKRLVEGRANDLTEITTCWAIRFKNARNSRERITIFNHFLEEFFPHVSVTTKGNTLQQLTPVRQITVCGHAGAECERNTVFPIIFV